MEKEEKWQEKRESDETDETMSVYFYRKQNGSKFCTAGGLMDDGHGTAVTTREDRGDTEMGDAAQERGDAVQPAADVEDGKV